MLASVRRSRSRPLHAAVIPLPGLAVAFVAAPASGEQADEPAAKAPAARQQLPGSFRWSSGGDYSQLPWQLALATNTSRNC